MKWKYEITDNADALIYDHTDEHVTTAYNDEPPSIRSKNGLPVDPDVKGAICDYVCREIEADDFPTDEAKQQYVSTAQTVLAADRIEERDDSS